jgi:UDP-glucose 4-epimerase
MTEQRGALDVLVTGGAGYIGSVVTEQLLEAGHNVLVFDNLSEGHGVAVSPEAKLIVGDILDRKALHTIFASNHFDVVVHLAAETVVARSMRDPRRILRTNVVGGLNLLEEMVDVGVLNLVFSSSAAIYGELTRDQIAEDDPHEPVNPYGQSKLMTEQMLAWFHRAYHLNSVSLRYFNAAGATRAHGEDHQPETHIIPNILKVALGKDSIVPIFGTDFPTPDGTALRDYVHVADIADAHLRAIAKVNVLGCRSYNLGSGHGYSVQEVVDAARFVTKKPIISEAHDRRPGDPAALVASNALAKQELGWDPSFTTLESIVESAWDWHRHHPDGYSL